MDKFSKSCIPARNLSVWSTAFFAFSCLLLITSVCLAQLSVAITSPTTGTVFAPGSSIQVTVDTSANTFAFVGVAVSGPELGPFKVLTSPPYQFTLPLSGGSTGPRQITAVAWDQAGNGVLSMPVTVYVESSSSVSSIEARPAAISFSAVGEQIPLTVNGTFSDGTTADLTTSSGTDYKSTNPNVAQVDNSGLVTAVGPGGTTTTVTYGGISASIPVVVPLGSAAPVYRVIAVPVGTVSKDAAGNYMINVNLTNNSNVTLALLTFTSIMLNNKSVVPLPGAFTEFAPNMTQTLTLTFPVSAGVSGATAALQLKGTYEGPLKQGRIGDQGALSFSFRVRLP